MATDSVYPPLDSIVSSTTHHPSMTVRILHTSDWHLGVSINNQSCEEEQRRYLEWLGDEIRDREADALIVAGDVFHYASPSNTAREMYYEFLVDCATNSPLEQVVIVGGNHDSPTGLEAPRELLRYLDIQVVGGLPTDEQTRRERCLVPVGGEDGEPEIVVAAIPYARRAQLGVALDDDSGRPMHRRFQAAFEDLYADIADAASEKHPQAALVATGHLTCYAPSNEPETGDYHSALHGSTDTRELASRGDDEGDSIGNIGAMSPSVFGDDYDYVALGHIHRMMRVGDRQIWYSGTPVPTSLDESTTRRMLQVDIAAGSAETSVDVEPVEVPTWRRLYTLKGDEDAIADDISELSIDEPLPPYLFLSIEVESGTEAYYEPEERLREHIAETFPDTDERPRVVGVRVVDPDAGGVNFENDLPPLEDLSPREVFEKRYQSRHGKDEAPPDDLVEAFEEVQQAYHDTDDTTA